MQAARGVVDLAVELAAGVQRGHDDLERRLVLELGVRIDGNAAAVVGHRQVAVGRQFDLDPGRVAGDRLVHRVVDHLGEQMVQRLLVGAADVHAGAPPDGLQPFQHLDVGRRIAVGGIAGLGPARARFGLPGIPPRAWRIGRVIRPWVPCLMSVCTALFTALFCPRRTRTHRAVHCSFAGAAHANPAVSRAARGNHPWRTLRRTVLIPANLAHVAIGVVARVPVHWQAVAAGAQTPGTRVLSGSTGTRTAMASAHVCRRLSHLPVFVVPAPAAVSSLRSFRATSSSCSHWR